MSSLTTGWLTDCISMCAAGRKHEKSLFKLFKGAECKRMSELFIPLFDQKWHFYKCWNELEFYLFCSSCFQQRPLFSAHCSLPPIPFPAPFSFSLSPSFALFRALSPILFHSTNVNKTIEEMKKCIEKHFQSVHVYWWCCCCWPFTCSIYCCIVWTRMIFGKPNRFHYIFVEYSIQSKIILFLCHSVSI